MLNKKGVINMANFKKVRRSDGTPCIAYTKVLHEFHEETDNELYTYYSVLIPLGNSGIKPLYCGSIDSVHYYSFKTRLDRDKFLDGFKEGA
tara:strand:- start:573 stop:845 length:273 start_codon:yes stop_codon:yes gene_type:complete